MTAGIMLNLTHVRCVKHRKRGKSKESHRSCSAQQYLPHGVTLTPRLANADLRIYVT